MIPQLLQQAQSAMRQGQPQRARDLLSNIEFDQVPVDQAALFASLLRQSDLTDLSLKFLLPWIRPEQGLMTSHQDLKSEYAANLIRNGSLDEAQELLQTVDPNYGQAHLYRALLHMRRWDYAAALGPLAGYLNGNLPNVARSVGELNQIACWVAIGDFPRARDALAPLIEDLKARNLRKLLFSALETRAQIGLFSGEFDQADHDLQSCLAMKDMMSSGSAVYVRKWQAILASERTGDATELLRLRENLMATHQFEGLRDCDLFLLKNKFDEDRYLHLVHGTPWPAYRQRVSQILGRGLPTIDYVYGAKDGVIYDLSTGQFGEKSLDGKLHLAVQALNRDLYKAPKVAEMFASIFPGEFYNPFTSPNRVYQLIHRLKVWVADQNLNLSVVERDGHYQLAPGTDFAFRFGFHKPHVQGPELELQRLRDRLGGAVEFSPREAREALQISKSSVQRLTEWAVDSGRLVRRGAARYVVYKFVA